jgi:hypothetical protein
MRKDSSVDNHFMNLLYFSGCKLGEMSEWFMEPVLKTGDAERHRGFKSLSLRQHQKIEYGEVPKWL